MIEPEVVAAFTCFGLLVVVPIVFGFLRHQRQMAEILRNNVADHDRHRIATLEQQVKELQALRYEQIIRADDEADLKRRFQSMGESS